MSEGKRTGPKTAAGLQVASRNLDPVGWTQNPEAVEAINVARRLRQTKHGLYASVPIICKARACPYAHSCPLLEMDMAPFGEKCPIEIAAIEDLFHRYCKELGIDPDNEENTVDLIMVKELVDIDISLLRCDNKMAIDADFIIDQVVGMTEEGHALTRQELHPVVSYKEKLLNQKHKTLQLLNSTRKDKQGSRVTHVLDASERAAELLRVKNDMQSLEENEKEAEQTFYAKFKGKVIDVEPIGFEEQDS
ncbi:hypothetical protein [Alicyclobacillus shizuokensis]|uniref:hypothetical protein n=1 Tax=Alicyclobacillus shizuokensis TaxID=392014 RepID=UPI0008330C18|nr:hypothetical protein [Alicyclobacillus shizuokensis]